MFKPTASSDHYIRMNKKICDKDIIKVVSVICQETRQSPVEVCYRLLSVAAQSEIKRRQRIAEIVRQTNAELGEC
jgi:lysyl-tRNA synthetase class I